MIIESAEANIVHGNPMNYMRMPLESKETLGVISYGEKSAKRKLQQPAFGMEPPGRKASEQRAHSEGMVQRKQDCGINVLPLAKACVQSDDSI